MLYHIYHSDSFTGQLRVMILPGQQRVHRVLVSESPTPKLLTVLLYLNTSTPKSFSNLLISSLLSNVPPGGIPLDPRRSLTSLLARGDEAVGTREIDPDAGVPRLGVDRSNQSFHVESGAALAGQVGADFEAGNFDAFSFVSAPMFQ
jgi:hypothetical protein